MNQNPQSSTAKKHADKHTAQAAQRTAARLAAASMMTVAASVGAHVGDYPDTNWHLRKQRPSAFGDSKNHPGFNNEVNANTNPIEVPDVPTPTPGAVSAVVQPNPEQGPLEVPQLPKS